MAKKTKCWIRVATVTLLFLFVGFSSWLFWRYYPYVKSLMVPENMEHFRQQLQSFGLLGIVVLLAAQLLQVISGIIPALPIQLSAGVTYGALGGAIICLGGVLLGSALVFMTVKRFGQPLVNRVFSAHKQQKLAFLQDASQLDLIVFIIYLIPAMPKDVLTYLAALTPLTLKRFLIITLIARAPTILCNTFASSALLEGDYLASTITFCITGGLGLVCILCSKRILEWMRHR